ncbi:hypothetical protein BV22DRAFT_1132666 [Leucogyrophana mollusca]|uniref:Uncharacterized protein n=1 Tax=Leucogyrophana mollusca TaxID=85980 RepID=A0ACB8B5C5_9AGAM|nr:hypothetical protein BV22DRAFT_1132666 [Leucogyrophana mollusca]
MRLDETKPGIEWDEGWCLLLLLLLLLIIIIIIITTAHPMATRNHEKSPPPPESVGSPPALSASAGRLYTHWVLAHDLPSPGVRSRPTPGYSLSPVQYFELGGGASGSWRWRE